MLDTRTFRKRLTTELAIGIGGTLALIIIAAFVRSDVNRRAGEVQAARADIAAANRAVESLATLSAGAEQLPGYQARLDAALPPAAKREQAILALRKDLQELAAAHKLTSAFSFGAQTAATPAAPGSVTFTVTLEGALSDIVAFSRALERTSPVVGVEAVEVSKRTSGFAARIEGKLFTR